MSFIKKLEYFFIELIGLVLLAFLEFFVLDDVLDILSTLWLVHALVFVLMVLFINPLIIYYLMNLIPFNKKRKDSHKKINKID